jgi:uncharacterized RDD family membrane protein YckC
MVPPASPAETPAKRPSTVATVAVMLTIAIMGSLWVPIFARSQPRLAGFPFFYWYQLILVPVTALLCWICYLLLRARPRRGAPGRGATRGGRR